VHVLWVYRELFIPVKFATYISYLPLDIIRKTVFFYKFICAFY